MKAFLDNDFLLQNDTARKLYHDFAADLPIIDYHCHLPPDQIAADTRFDNLTQAWLSGDHYKWRAMRAQGIPERSITGNASDAEKFQAWAETVPYTLRNPLYHWTHLELRRYFNIDSLLSPATSREVYEEAGRQLQQPAGSVRGMLARMKVSMVCTTDDPVDSLASHIQLRSEKFGIPVLPAFRPDAAMNVSTAAVFNGYVARLEKTADRVLPDYDSYLEALRGRHDFFAAQGCAVSDHGLEEMYADDPPESELRVLYLRLRAEKPLEFSEQKRFKSGLLRQFAEWDHEKNWVQQFHLGAMRNNNTRMHRTLGPDTGWDSIGDFTQLQSLGRFLDRLDRDNKLARTIIYNLNPADNAGMASMIGNFNDGSVAGKIQWGSAWWFLDQKDGMTRQLNTLSNMGLLSRFVGMLTDSRSFLSFPRHEYFRRLICQLFGEEIEKGELPGDIPWTGKIIRDICFYNARNYFGWENRIPAP